MLNRPVPMSNVERQRNFRERHPGYRNRYRRRLDAVARTHWTLDATPEPAGEPAVATPSATSSVPTSAPFDPTPPAPWHASA